MRKVAQSLSPSRSSDALFQPARLPPTHAVAPSLSSSSVEARRNLPKASNDAGSERQKRPLTSWRAIANHVIEKMKGPEVMPEPPYSPAYMMAADPSDAVRAIRREQAKQLQGTVKQWQLHAGVPKAKADLQALTWRGKYKRASPEQFSAEAAGLLCTMLDRLATTRAANPPELNAVLSRRVVTLLDAMIAEPAVRARCLRAAAHEMGSGGAHAETMLAEMEVAAHGRLAT